MAASSRIELRGLDPTSRRELVATATDIDPMLHNGVKAGWSPQTSRRQFAVDPESILAYPSRKPSQP